MKQRLSFAIALLHDPQVLLLDEPCAAIDPVSRDMLFQLLSGLRDEGRTIVLTTHQLEEAEQYCDRACVLERGRAAAVGRPADVLHAGASVAAVQGVLGREPG